MTDLCCSGHMSSNLQKKDELWKHQLDWHEEDMNRVWKSYLLNHTGGGWEQLLTARIFQAIAKTRKKVLSLSIDYLRRNHLREFSGPDMSTETQGL